MIEQNNITTTDIDRLIDLILDINHLLIKHNLNYETFIRIVEGMREYTSEQEKRKRGE